MNKTLLLFAIACSSACLPSGANGGSPSTDFERSAASVHLISEMGRKTDIFNHVPFSQVTMSASKRATYYSHAIFSIGTTPDESQVNYFCGVMRSSRGVVRAPALDSVMISRKMPDGRTLSMFVESIPWDTTAQGAAAYPQHMLSGISDGANNYYQLTNLGESPSAQACASSKLGDAQTCRAIDPFFPGGMPISLMDWGVKGCNAFVESQNLSGIKFVMIGSDEANAALASRHGNYFTFQNLFHFSPK